MQLEADDCRYIIFGAGHPAVYCGARVDKGYSWCGQHKQIVFRPMVPWTEKQAERVAASSRHQFEKELIA
jgi:hypothetical protein